MHIDDTKIFFYFCQGKSTEIKCECLDILGDMLQRFGNLMTKDAHEELLSALLSQLGSNQASVRKKSILCIGEKLVISKGFLLMYSFEAPNFSLFIYLHMYTVVYISLEGTICVYIHVCVCIHAMCMCTSVMKLHRRLSIQIAYYPFPCYNFVMK